MMRTFLILCAALVLGGCAQGPAGMADSAPSAYSSHFTSACLPLWVPTDRSRGTCSLYKFNVLGIEIDSIEADGVVIEGRDHVAYYDDFDWGTFLPKGQWHVYQVLWGWTEGDQHLQLIGGYNVNDSGWDMKEYLIPIDTESLIIRYRPRYPLNELGKPIVANAKRYEFSL